MPKSWFVLWKTKKRNMCMIYIYIVNHRQTASFYQNSSVWLDTQDARSRDRNPSNFTLDCVSDHSSTKRTTLTKGILRYFYLFIYLFYFFFFFETAAAFVYILLYPIGYQRAQFFRRALHYASGGRQFLRQGAQPPWGSIYTIYIYIRVSIKKILISLKMKNYW